ncbi:MAG: hypothetical protein JRI68_12735 [Deltaproteobacteria bacterium]|nr:hypothetical protein [Deltaproteobacteria bacterium]
MTILVKTLAEKVAEEGPLRVRDGLGWVLRATRTVELLHAQGVAHGRISPDAILVEDGECSSAGELLHPRDVPDRPDYHGLDRATSDKPSGADDVWALRVMLYFLITGEQPYPDGVSAAVTSSGRLRPPARLAVHSRDLTVMQPLMDEMLEPDSRVDLLADPTTLAHQLQRFSPTIADLPALEADFVKNGELAPKSRGKGQRKSAAPATDLPASGAERAAPAWKRQSGHLGPVVIALGAAALVAAFAFSWRREAPPSKTPGRATGNAVTPTSPTGTALPLRKSGSATARPSATTSVAPVPPSGTAQPEASTPPATSSAAPEATAPLTGPQLAECVLPVVATKLTSTPDLAFLCDEPDALRCVRGLTAALRKVQAREGRGAARAWERLGWYQMAALALARQHCCATPAGLHAPDSVRGCHLDEALTRLMEGESEAAFITALGAYTKAIRCIEQIQPKDWPAVGSPTLVQQSALLRKRSQAVGDR